MGIPKKIVPAEYPSSLQTGSAERAKEPASRTLLISALAGLGAGLVGAYIMDRAQSALPPPETGDDDPATVVAANRLYRGVTGDALPEADKGQAGAVMHYAFGGALGVVYGVAAEIWPSVTRGQGILFGLSAALVLDEALVPAVGITKPPSHYDAKVHLYSLLSHAVFGLSVEVARRSLRRVGSAIDG